MPGSPNSGRDGGARGGPAPASRGADATYDRRRAEPVSVRLETSAEIDAPLDPGLGRARRLAGPVPLDPVHHGPDRDRPRRRAWAYAPTALSGFWLGGSRSGCWTGSSSPAGRRRPAADGPRRSSRCCTWVRTSPARGCSRLRSAGDRHHGDLRRAVRPARRRVAEPPGRLLLPVLRRGFAVSLRRFAAVCESSMTPPARPRRPAALPLGARRPEYLDYHDHEWGQPVTSVGRAVRAAEPGGLPVRPVLDHHPAQAGGFRRPSPGSIPRAWPEFDEADVDAADGRSGDRPQPGQDQRHHRQRRGGRRARRAVRPR